MAATVPILNLPTGDSNDQETYEVIYKSTMNVTDLDYICINCTVTGDGIQVIILYDDTEIDNDSHNAGTWCEYFDVSAYSGEKTVQVKWRSRVGQGAGGYSNMAVWFKES
jgi:hypothetical protein